MERIKNRYEYENFAPGDISTIIMSYDQLPIPPGVEYVGFFPSTYGVTPIEVYKILPNGRKEGAYADAFYQYQRPALYLIE